MSFNEIKKDTNFNIFAIIGATASGKSKIAIGLAEKLNANILSLDSLAIYREIDIASAKPTKNELEQIKHFGIDILNPDQKFDAQYFIKIYKNAIEISRQENKKLIIVGGTSFYLKSLLVGFSEVPEIHQNIISERNNLMANLDEAYNFLYIHDKNYAEKIGNSDSYRIEKAIDILLSTGFSPTEWFLKNPPKPVINFDLPIFNLIAPRENIRERIKYRTADMIKNGLIDEVENLLKKYGLEIQPMKAIGIKETLQFINGEIKKIDELENLISIHTGQLAKRQETFNRTQFKNYQIKDISILNYMLESSLLESHLEKFFEYH